MMGPITVYFKLLIAKDRIIDGVIQDLIEKYIWILSNEEKELYKLIKKTNARQR